MRWAQISTSVSLGQANHYIVKGFSTGNRAAFDTGIRLIQVAMAKTSPGREEYEACNFALINALRLRFERTGDTGDLDRAITAGRDAVTASREGPLADPGLLSNLGCALMNRFELIGDPADLDEGADVLEQAVGVSKARPAVRVAAMSNLAAALRQQAQRTGRVSTLDKSIATGRRVLGDPACRPADRSAVLANLANALRMRAEWTGDPGDLDEAVDAGRQALAATQAQPARRALRLNNLTMALRLRSARTGSARDLDEAVEVARAAVAGCPEGDPARALYLSNLGAVHRMRFERLRDVTDLEAAIAASRAAVALESAPARVRAVAARGWGSAAAAGGRWQEAIDGFAVAVGLLDKVAPRSLARSGQEHQLDDLSGVGVDAAACCVQAGQETRGVELFEEGRGVLLGQALDARTDITALAAANAGLAGEFAALLTQLDQAGRLGEGTASAWASGDGAEDHVRAGLDRRRRLAERLDEVVARIRGLPGFERFLRPLRFAELSAAALAGPVVIVNVSQFGSSALILTADGVQPPLPLPELSPDAVLDRVAAFLGALDEASPPARERGIEATLTWLWNAVVGPVAGRLALPGPHQDGEPWPRLWWCPSGLLSLLPLHAARPPGAAGPGAGQLPPAVSDRVVSSYTPTLRALIHARRPRPPDAEVPLERARAGGRIVAVAMPSTPGQADLPEAQAEVTGLRDRFPGRVTVLAGRAATFETVAAALPGVQWAHFACHAFSDPARPSESALLLSDYEDRRLAYPDIARLDLGHAELAFLSACATARAGARLADEAIQLVSAFQLAGCRHVIGTLWPVGDRRAREIAEEIYPAIADGADVAVAVHEAARRLRRQRPGWPSEWASHVHFGA